MLTVRHSLPFDPSYGYDLPGLFAIEPPPGPDGFADFWRGTWREAAAVPLRVEQRPASFQAPGKRVYEVSFDSWNNRRVGAWVVEPEHAHPAVGLVVGHGYGGRSEPNLQPAFGDQLVQIYPCAPGFHLSPASHVPLNDAALHVRCGIGHRDTYVIRDCVASLWTACRVLTELYPNLTRHVYQGESFGGGLGALMCPWEPSLIGAILKVPTFGHHPLRLQCECHGSGQSVRLYARKHPEVVQTLAWYDAATAAAHLTIPTLTAPAWFDPAVPPPGQFAVANAIRSRGSRVLVTRFGHYDDHPLAADDYQRYVEASREFIGRLVPPVPPAANALS